MGRILSRHGGATMSEYRARGRGRRESARGELGLERLERRLLLSGNVTVEVVDGNLVITGDDQDNSIDIDQAGLPEGQFRILRGDLDTTINGIPGPVTAFNVTKDVKIRMGDGNDEVDIVDVSVPRHLVFDGAEGDNTFGVYDTDKGVWVGLPLQALTEALVLAEALHAVDRIDERNHVEVTVPDAVSYTHLTLPTN